MTQWIVGHVPAWLVLVGLIVVVVGGALVTQTWVRRRFPALSGDEHNDVTKFTYGFIGFVYAFFIGFVVSSMWGQINTADGNARNEGAAAVQMARDAEVFEGTDRERLRAALLHYERAAIDEWNQLPAAGAGADADAALARLSTAYQQVAVTSDTQKTYLATSYANLGDIGQARTVRLLTAREDTGPPWPLWFVIFLTSAMVLGTVIVYGVEKPRMHYPMVVVVGLVVAANLFLILELSHPYVGDISTSTGPLDEAVAVLTSPRG